MSREAPVVFLFDVDNTLLDNDRIKYDLDRRVAAGFGPEGAAKFWSTYEDLRGRLGYADLLGAIQVFRLECDDAVRAQELAEFLLDYDFAARLFPRALEAIRHLSRSGPCVVVLDGDAVLQPRKIRNSGIAAAVQDQVLIYVHKQRMLQDVERRYPARHYVMVEDKLEALDGIRRRWGDRVTTVLVRQGHYAEEQSRLSRIPPAQVTLREIGELCDLPAVDLVSPPAKPQARE